MLLATNEWNAREVASSEDEGMALLFVTGAFPIPDCNTLPRLLECGRGEGSKKVLNLSLVFEAAVEDAAATRESFDQARFRKEIPRGAYKKIIIEYLGQPLVTLDVANA